MLQKNNHGPFGLDRFKPDDPDHSYTLPAKLYYDNDVLEAEIDSIFYKSWNFVCHAHQLEAPGSYTTVRVGDQNIAVIRGNDGIIRGFHNVCSHRAHQLLSSGRTRLIVCPYHAWAYELDGTLRSNPVLDTVEGCHSEEFCLKPVRTELFMGFVWINLNLNPQSLAEQSGKLGDDIRCFVDSPETLEFAKRFTFQLKGNWKNVVEKFQECYHCPPAHPAFVDLIDHGIYRIETYAICSSHIAPSREGSGANCWLVCSKPFWKATRLMQ